jgi:hypothetical protein
MNEFQLTLANIAARRSTSISQLAKLVGYEPFLFENIVAGKTRQVPVDFFIRIADVLELSTVETDDLVRSWAFGIERWNWSLKPERAGEEESGVRERQKLRVGGAAIGCIVPNEHALDCGAHRVFYRSLGWHSTA